MYHSVLGLWARSIAFYCICDRIFDCIMVFVFFANSKEKPNWKLQLRISLFTSHTDCSFLFFLLSSLNLSGRKLRAILTSFSCLFCICDLFSRSLFLSFLSCGPSHDRSGKTLYFRDRLERMILRREERLNCFVWTFGKSLVWTDCLFGGLTHPSCFLRSMPMVKNSISSVSSDGWRSSSHGLSTPSMVSSSKQRNKIWFSFFSSFPRNHCLSSVQIDWLLRMAGVQIMIGHLLFYSLVILREFREKFACDRNRRITGSEAL